MGMVANGKVNACFSFLQMIFYVNIGEYFLNIIFIWVLKNLDSIDESL